METIQGTVIAGSDTVQVPVRRDGSRLAVPVEHLDGRPGGTCGRRACAGATCASGSTTPLALAVDDAVDLEAFAAAVGRAVAVDADEAVVVLGVEPVVVDGGPAVLPDLELADLEGRPVRLGDLAGGKTDAAGAGPAGEAAATSCPCGSRCRTSSLTTA